MRFLPALVAGSSKARLPLCDASAECLTRVLVGGDPEPLGSLIQRLAGDPPLAVWAVCSAWGVERRCPTAMDELADGLLRHLPAIVQWEADADGLPESPVSIAEPFAAQVAVDLELAELAVQVASRDETIPAEQARFRGLLAHAPTWLSLAATDAAHPPLECLPPWLRDGLVISSSPVAGEIDREHVEAARRQWLQSGSGWAEVLPPLAARMARLGQLEGQFQATLEAEKLAAMAEFAAGAGHEINNPLAIIAGRAQLLLADEADPERRRELAVIHAQVKRAHEMIADMRLFARPPQPERKRFDLIPLLDAVVADLAAQGAERAIQVVRLGEATPLELEADPTQLEVVLRAMGKNALELIAQGGQIQFAAQQTGAEVCIQVSDDGPGIAPDERQHLFDPFYSARQAGRGLGLGLSKCWRIVTNHGGRIEVHSQPGQGATFAIFLPQHAGDVPPSLPEK